MAKITFDYENKKVIFTKFVVLGNMRPIEDAVLTFGINDEIPENLLNEMTPQQREDFTWFWIDCNP